MGGWIMSERDPAPATTILLEEIAPLGEARAWLVPGGEAALARGLAATHPHARIHWQPVDLRERDAVAPVPPTLRIEPPGAPSGPVDAAAVAAPPDRDLARRWLLEARAALAPGGVLALAGANAEGIRSIISDARAIFGPPRHEAFRRRQRFALFTAGPEPPALPAWATAPGVAPGTWQPFTLPLDGQAVPLVTQAGVFAGGRIDAGTRLLLDALPEQVAGAVLDVGCGAGVLGIAASLRGAAGVDLVDANLLAVQATAENLRRLGLPGARALASDVYGGLGDARYDLIVSNPPFHRGKVVDLDVADRLIHGAPAHLQDAGSLLLVANAFLAYGQRMARVFERVETVVATRQYNVLRASGPLAGTRARRS
jgi:16S rRNA (guanine1207-N2)-methyltransferase